MTRNVCEEILNTLIDAGVTQIFGVTGDALNPLVDAIRRDGRLRWIGVRHEETAAYAATAYSQITGKLGVCAGTVGPGAMHLLNGLYNAHKEGASVLAITGQVPRADAGTGFFQEVNLTQVFSEVCVFQQTVTSPEQMPRLIQQAIQNALSAPGVARIELPSDMTALPVPSEAMSHPIFTPEYEVVPCEPGIAKAADILNAAKKPTIFVSSGCTGARD